MSMQHDHTRALEAIARRDFASFVRLCFNTLSPGKPFLPNWHIQAMAYQLEEVMHGRIRRQITTMPPRSLKSIIASVAFPAWMLGRDPTKRIITVSYAADLAIKHANDCRAVLGSKWYQRVFPHTRISSRKDTEAEIVTTQNGFRLTTSLEGTLTGRGGDVVIIDDPLKPIDALSDSRREKVNQWFAHTALSRLDDKRTGAIVIVMQRLHMDDLVGYLLRHSPEEWSVLSLPAISDHNHAVKIDRDTFYTRLTGDILHPERESESDLRSILAQQGSEVFAAQYLQQPVPPGGFMIKHAWVRRYERLPERLPGSQIIQSWDTASKDGSHNDFSVCTTWLIQAGKYYLVDVLRGRFDYPGLKARAIAHARVHSPTRIIIEDTGVGTALISELKLQGLPTIPIKPERDKVTRMAVQTAKIESGQVFFPERAPWLPELEAELFSFPQSPHDDQVDSISQLLGYPLIAYDPGALADGLARVFFGYRRF